MHHWWQNWHSPLQAGRTITPEWNGLCKRKENSKSNHSIIASWKQPNCYKPMHQSNASERVANTSRATLHHRLLEQMLDQKKPWSKANNHLWLSRLSVQTSFLRWGIRCWVFTSNRSSVLFIIIYKYLFQILGCQRSLKARLIEGPVWRIERHLLVRKHIAVNVNPFSLMPPRLISRRSQSSFEQKKNNEIK